MWICKPCGKENRNDRIHCWSCSTPIDETAVMDERPPSPFNTHNSESNFNSQVAKISSAASQSSKPIPASLNKYMTEEMNIVSGKQDINSDTQFPTETIYSDKSIWVGAGLGGPLVAGYIIARNFEEFDEPDKAKVTWIITIMATVLIFGVAFLLTDVAGKAIPGIYAGIAYLLIRRHQGARIDAHIRAGGATHSGLNVVGISIVGLVIMLPFIGIALAAGSNDTRTTYSFPVRVAYPAKQRFSIESTAFKTYGVLGHEVYFVPGNISVEEIDKLAAGLEKTRFFKEAPQKFLFVIKDDDNYEISIACNSKVTTDPDAYKPFVPLRKSMQKLFPNNKITLNLVVDGLDNVVKQIE